MAESVPTTIMYRGGPHAASAPGITRITHEIAHATITVDGTQAWRVTWPFAVDVVEVQVRAAFTADSRITWGVNEVSTDPGVPAAPAIPAAANVSGVDKFGQFECAGLSNAGLITLRISEPMAFWFFRNVSLSSATLYLTGYKSA